MKSDKMKQIFMDLIYVDHDLYCKKVGINDRLFIYQRLRNFVQCIVIAIDIALYVYWLFVLKSTIVALLEQSGYFFELFTKTQLIKLTSIGMLNVTIPSTLVYAGTLFLLTEDKYNFFQYGISKCFRFLCFFYMGYIATVFCFDLIIDTWIGIMFLILIKIILISIIQKVNSIIDFATKLILRGD